MVNICSDILINRNFETAYPDQQCSEFCAECIQKSQITFSATAEIITAR